VLARVDDVRRLLPMIRVTRLDASAARSA
jgi:hypothetical protein